MTATGAASDRPAGVRVVLPRPLRSLAGVEGEVVVDVAGPVTAAAVLDAIEARFPVLRGAIRDPRGGGRRPLVRLFACREDWSHAALDAPLPAEVAEGREPLHVIGAMAGG